jgi:hypothetical protein
VSRRQLTGKGLHLNDPILGGNVRGRPGRDRSCKPAKRSSKNRLRHMLTTSRRQSSRSAMRSLESPSAASKIILARTTSKYGNVYLPPRRRNSRSSSSDRTISYGLRRGKERTPPLLHHAIRERTFQLKIRCRIYEREYLVAIQNPWPS